jgi:nucleotide-binding universal stress UspA family protein
MKILFATDGSETSRIAERFLASLPLPASSDLTVVSVMELPHLGMPAVAGDGGLVVPTEPPREAVQWVEEHAQRAAGALAREGVTSKIAVQAGHPVDVICRLAEEQRVDLVVVGSHGRSAVGRLILGSVSTGVVKHATVPVLVVKAPFKPLNRVLVGVDGSSGARRAVDFMKEFPLPADAQILLLSVVHVPPPFPGVSEGYYETLEMSQALDALRKGAEAGARRALDAASDTLKPAHAVETRIASGPPARTLLDLSGSLDSQLVVVGSRGLTGVERLLMGSVSLQLVLHSKTSVLVVR